MQAVNRTWIWILLAGWIATAGLLLWSHRRAEFASAEAVRSLEGNSRRLRDLEAQLRADNETLRKQLSEVGVEPAAPVRQGPSPSTEKARLEAVQALAQLQQKSAAMQASLQELQARTKELETALDNAKGEIKQAATVRADLEDKLASVQRVVTASDQELKVRDERLTSLETQLRRTQDSSAAADRKLSQVTAVLRDMEDINRRREAALTSLQRRYRELTDTWRAFAMRVDSSRDSNPTVNVSDVSRIQATVQAAEEEIRQLNSLNTQATRVAARLK
jgi:chromosome segregation ATPase